MHSFVHVRLLLYQIQIRINYIIICVYKSFYVCIVIGFNYGCWFAMRAKNRKSNHRFLSHPYLVRDLYTRCYTICAMRCLIICLGWTCVGCISEGIFYAIPVTVEMLIDVMMVRCGMLVSKTFPFSHTITFTHKRTHARTHIHIWIQTILTLATIRSIQ